MSDENLPEIIDDTPVMDADEHGMYVEQARMEATPADGAANMPMHAANSSSLYGGGGGGYIPASQPARYGPPMDHAAGESNIDMLMEVALQLHVELGRTRMTVRQVLDLNQGSVVELDRMAGEAVDIFVNNHRLARGEVVVVDDKFGVRITEMSSGKQKTNGSGE